MTIEPDQIRAQVAELLADVPLVLDAPGDPDAPVADEAFDMELVAQRLEAAHEVLVQALASVENG